jgi:leader peptidase (prepilin peptidase) / N-methyltransferase
MSTPTTLVAGVALGMALSSFLTPLTRRELQAALERSSTQAGVGSVAVPGDAVPPRVTLFDRVVLAIASSLVPAYVLQRVGWAPAALPPLLLVVGLVQLAYCDLTHRLLPKTLVYALTAAVIASGVTAAGYTGEWHRLLQASLGGLACFGLFFAVNLMNPRWMGFGDVRLSLVFGFGLAWVDPMALLQAFLYANLLAAIVGLLLIVAHRAGRRSDVPFGLYMALGAALVLIAWS